MQSVTLPDGITEIEKSVFEDCSNLKSMVFPCALKTVGEGAFCGCVKLKEAELPETVTVIGSSAFENCAGLEHFHIPFGVSRICKDTFFGCKSLPSVFIPEGVKEIGEYAFYNCESLKSLDLPQSVKCIEKNAFSYCRSLQSIAVKEGNSVYHSEKNCLIDTARKALVAGCQSSVIPTDGSVTKIGDEAFYGCEFLREIVIPSTVTNIEGGAFGNCESLENVSIPDTVTKIGRFAFSNCRNLQIIEIPKSVTFIGYRAFHGCHSLQDITIGSGVKSIEKEAFPASMNLRRWVLARDAEDEEQSKMILRMIGVKALAYSFLSDHVETNAVLRKHLSGRITARNFREEFVPVLIKCNESEALAKLLSLAERIYLKELESYIKGAENRPEIRIMLMEYKNKMYPAEEIERMRMIQMEKAFGLREKTTADYKKIFSLVKGKDFYMIGSYKGEDSLVIIPARIEGLPVKMRVCAFQSCGCIQDVYIEEGLTEIGDYVFFGCVNLKTVTIPKSVEHIGIQAFGGCRELTVFGSADSCAERYAEENDINFQEK